MRLWFVLLLIALAAPLRAEPACETIVTLERLVSQGAAGDLGGLARALRRTDSARVMWELRGHPLAAQRRDIDAVLSRAAEAVALDRSEGAVAARAHLDSRAARRDRARLAALLARHACPVGTGAARAAADEGAAQQAGGPQAGPRMPQIAGFAAAALALAAIATLMAGRMLRRAKRRGKRHAVNLPARIRSGTAETETRLVDISQQGAKLRLDAGFEPAGLRGVTILLGDRRIGATARWRNKHYLGVQFLRPLPEDAVAPILTQTDPEAGEAQPG